MNMQNNTHKYTSNSKYVHKNKKVVDFYAKRGMITKEPNKQEPNKQEIFKQDTFHPLVAKLARSLFHNFTWF